MSQVSWCMSLVLEITEQLNFIHKLHVLNMYETSKYIQKAYIVFIKYSFCMYIEKLLL